MKFVTVCWNCGQDTFESPSLQEYVCLVEGCLEHTSGEISTPLLTIRNGRLISGKTHKRHFDRFFFLDCICTLFIFIYSLVFFRDDLSPSYMGSNERVTVSMRFRSGFLAGLQGDQMRTEVSQMGRDACTKYEALLKGS